MKRLFDGGVIILVVIGLFGWFMSNDHETTPPETECLGAGCEQGEGSSLKAPPAKNPPNPPKGPPEEK